MSQTTHPGTRPEHTNPSLHFRFNDVSQILENAALVQKPTDLVIAPVDLHQRHLKQRITHADKALSTFDFTDGAAVAKRLLNATDQSTKSLDRVDRLDLLEEILSVESNLRNTFEVLLGHDPAANVKAVEQTRSEIEAITNYHPTRVGSFRDALKTRAGPIEADARDVLYGVLSVEGALRQYSEKIPTETELLRQATRNLVNSDGSIWNQVYSNIERVTIVGMSNVSAPLIDLLSAIARVTDAEAAIWLRPGTGPYLRKRLPRTVVDGLGEVYTG